MNCNFNVQGCCMRDYLSVLMYGTETGVEEEERPLVRAVQMDNLKSSLGVE